ncbi:isoprenyl transferase [Marinomonas mediterranea]|jgi:Undecaprenyl pyrophosphate synthetase (EC 2.5.1.31)|uniref:Ditrans,polycis-undecaprenyl-diphosphate synthase ((2E,6E)-farnesyl-diphosphate specific) n=1 Tax=Marinomonas mediterranea (strain ATCC 700492 / JCM 21426 / NBRC 103028 / MMB-1) TaxID=717774 RepID=F2JU02_MARM1|nr:isoprenyl transferase [Marinomonas mediterranea]ADZ90423.1 Undecaprenyl pyrophosphate synthase [Marinomonas mediterranea MMB-1]WCN08477.1 isoprenyl transferase [Marinomonas mediterranea]WCN12532.1 isoprenyl transferase [Marinomonas mediterranea]WCN16603.1 isoprenyl transferase [Marinomonas mediterranea MMB-1]
MSLTTNNGEASTVPQHVAIIMDGNNRWAKKKLLPSIAGHTAGASAVRRTVEAAARAGVKVVTLFAFSSENWKRPKLEVDGLMNLFMRSLRKEVKRLNEYNIQLRVVGNKQGFSEKLQHQIMEAEQSTSRNDGMVLVIAANYGGRWDIAEAMKGLARDAIEGTVSVDDIDELLLAKYMQLSDLPEPDLLIRTSGEERVSNFLLWQLAYAEFVFLPVLWPDFSEQHFAEALSIYQSRQRRYGGR